MNKRYRLVTRQNGRQHVSSVILTDEEAAEQIEAERIMHVETGWTVSLVQDDMMVILICEKDGVTRTVGVRESEAMNDICSN